ncbi:MAG TPA: glycosyltransferase family 1 protein [Thermoanaerobaculia bacterium]|jgi:glycosyltransferase involved in cell wall biosynthesis|nr:glycosyltransferase family 1 protein [Thermoanaerobaculia bacterium]
MPSPPTPPTPPNIAADLRALVPAPTGIGVYTRSLLLALAERNGFRYVGMAHRPPREGRELEAAGIAVEHQEAPLGVLWQQLRLPRRLARGDVDLFWSPLFTLPLRCPVPAVVTVHDLTAILFPEAHTLKVRWSQLPFLRPSFERARRLVAVSEATARDLAFHFPQCAERIRVVYSGIDPEFRPGDPEEIAATRRELGAPEGYIFYAGTLEPRKNVGALVDAWEALRGENPQNPRMMLPLVLAGPYGWGSERLARRIEGLAPEGVRSLGRVDRSRLVRLFQAARIFVYPSLYEGFGFPAAEALACGVPVVATNSSSLPEVVGDAGLLAEPGDSGALAARIQILLGHPERAADLAARAVRQAARFRWEKTAAAMEEVFRETLEDQ